MKRILLSVASLALSLQSWSQGTMQHKTAEYISVGPIAEMGHSWVSNLYGQNKFNTTMAIGFGMIYSKDPHWGYGGNVLFSMEGYRVGDNAGNTYYSNPLYIRVPLRVYYFFGDHKSNVRPKVYLGPSFGVKVTEIDKFPNPEVYASNYLGEFRTFDLGLNGGAGVNVRLKKGVWLNADIGYYQGLFDAVKDPAEKYNTNQSVTASVGILFVAR